LAQFRIDISIQLCHS